jgi:hypothetical protein
MTIRFLVIFALMCIIGALCGCNGEGQPVPKIVGNAPHIILKPAPTVVAVVEPALINRYSHKWLPPGHVEYRRKWRGIIIHHSAVAYGDAAHENKYHKSLGWDGLGYHFVINNGVYKNGTGRRNGQVEVGYRWRKQETGSHCRSNGDRANYYNKHTIGICLIGNFEKTRPTSRQMKSLVELVSFLQKRYNIPKSRIDAHCDIKATKCPGKNFSMAGFKQRL